MAAVRMSGPQAMPPLLARFSQVARQAASAPLPPVQSAPLAWSERDRLDAAKRLYVGFLGTLSPAQSRLERSLAVLRTRAARDQITAAKVAIATAWTPWDKAFAADWLKAAEAHWRLQNAHLRALEAFASAPAPTNAPFKPEPPGKPATLVKPAQPIARPGDKPEAGAPVWKEAGAFVWHPGAFPTDIAIPKLKAAGVKWVAPQIADGMTVNQETAAVVESYIKRCREAGIKVGFWGVNRTSPEAEARLAADLCRKCGPDFYIANAEIEHKYTSADGSPSAEAYDRSQRWISTFRKALPDMPAALSSYGRADLADIDWKAWRDAGFDWLPQAYLNDFDSCDPKLAVEGAIKAGWPRDGVHPTLGLWGGGQTRVVPAGEYVESLRKAGTVGFSFYLAEQMVEADWPVLGEAIARGDLSR